MVRIGISIALECGCLRSPGFYLLNMGYKDEGMQDSRDVMISKQDDHGKWILENKFKGRVQVVIERKGKTSKLDHLKPIKGFKRI